MRLLRHTRACLDAAQRWPPDGRAWSGGSRARRKSIAIFESTFVDRYFARALPISPIFWVGPVFVVTAVQVHHFQDRECRFGVSSPLWDLVFGTYKPVPHVNAKPLEARSQSTMRLKGPRNA